jgi:hypothetical protein
MLSGDGWGGRGLGKTLYSGFHLAPQLASRAGGAPPARGTRGAVGGTGHVATRNRQDPFSEFDNIILLQS